jgi:hypothetical protein
MKIIQHEIKPFLIEGEERHVEAQNYDEFTKGYSFQRSVICQVTAAQNYNYHCLSILHAGRHARISIVIKV